MGKREVRLPLLSSSFHLFGQGQWTLIWVSMEEVLLKETWIFHKQRDLSCSQIKEGKYLILAKLCIELLKIPVKIPGAYVPQSTCSRM